MAIRDKIRVNAAAQLRPGEQIQSVFAGQTASQYLILLGVVIFLAANDYYTVVVTDQRILVCRSGKLSSTKVKSVLRELPRQTAIGPATGLWYKTAVLGVPLRIHKRWHKDIATADSLGNQSPGLTPDETTTASRDL
jgi:hypothetical protein